MTHSRIAGGMLLLLFCLGSGAAVVPQEKPGLAARIDGAVGSISGRGSVSPCDDGEFLRRVMLDLVGYPPNGEQVKVFYHDTNPKKRLVKIDELLATEDFADFWTRRFMEGLFGNYHNVIMEQVKPEPSGGARARMVNDFREWFQKRLHKDVPYNDIVYDMLDARGKSEGDPALAYKLQFYTGDGHAQEFASGVSRTLMGVRLLCARCHDHPFEKFTTDHYYGVAAFNARAMARGYGPSKEKDRSEFVELIEGKTGELMNPDNGKTAMPTWLIGGAAGKYDDRTTALAMFLTSKGNAYLPRALANRAWSFLFGRGVVHPVDDFNDQTWKRSPSPALLEAMTKDFMEHKYSIKNLVRGICASNTYQMSCSSDTKYEKENLSRAPVFQLNGWQLANSVAVATRGRPIGRGEIVEKGLDIARQLFPPGAPFTEVTPLPGNARQALLMRNNNEIMGAISGGGALSKAKSAGSTPEEKVSEMFLAALSRMPHERETERYVKFIKERGDQSWEDAYWTLLNLSEFVTRH